VCQFLYFCLPHLKFDYISLGPDYARLWIATTPQILNEYDVEILALHEGLESEICRTKKDTEKDLCSKILRHLKTE